MIDLRPPAHLVDPHAASDFFRQAGLDVSHARPEYVRHKPGDTTVISYLFETTSGERERGYAHWCTDPHRADEIDHKARTLRHTQSRLGSATVRLDRRTILYPFPNDARLRSLRWYTNSRKLKRTLADLAPAGERLSGSRSTVRILRYKPERRVVAAADLVTAAGHVRPVLIRYATARRANVLAATARELLGHGVSSPEPLLQLDDERVSVDEFIAGTELRTAVHDGTAEIDALADALGRFHATPACAPERNTRIDLASATAGLRSLEAWHPGFRSIAGTVHRELVRTKPDDVGERILLHGDLHDENIMITPAGDIAFVDLERVARGPAAIDLGRLRGVVRGVTVRQPGWSPDAIEHTEHVIDCYRILHPHRVTDHELEWHTAIALVDQALLVTRHFEDNWHANALALFDAALVGLNSNRPA